MGGRLVSEGPSLSTLGLVDGERQLPRGADCEKDDVIWTPVPQSTVPAEDHPSRLAS